MSDTRVALFQKPFRTIFFNLVEHFFGLVLQRYAAFSDRRCCDFAVRGGLVNEALQVQF